MSFIDTQKDRELLAPTGAGLLVDFIRRFDGVVVAFSGGVDSAVVAAAAYRALGEKAIAVTAKSPSVAAVGLDWARRTADEIGIRHVVIGTTEVDRADYQANDAKRCFWCKQSLYAALHRIADEEGLSIILSGTNADDLGDYRPGIEAGQQAGVIAPLAECGIPKAMVRTIAKEWGLSVWDLPAAPCLASRIAYGVPVTAERLRSIEQAEDWLRQRGFDEMRVRLHEGGIARVEVPPDEVPRITAPPIWPEITEAFRAIGFRYVTLDLAGLRSGNLNDLIQIGSPTRTESAPPTGTSGETVDPS